MATVDTTPSAFTLAVMDRVDQQRDRLFQVMGILSCAIAAADRDVKPNEPDLHYALKAAHQMINDVCGMLDPAHLEMVAQAYEPDNTDAGARAN